MAVCQKKSEAIKKEVGYEDINYYVPGCNVNIDNIIYIYIVMLV